MDLTPRQPGHPRRKRPKRHGVTLVRGAYSATWRVPPYRPSPPLTARPSARLARRALLFVGLSALLSVVLFVIASSSVASARVQGDSMEPALHDNELLVVNKLAYRLGSPGRGDIIIFRSRHLRSEAVKRIVGLPGETVEIHPGTGEVSIDGRALDEPYIRGGTSCRSICSWTVPPDSYFVMGDNRQRSRDSRDGWFLPRNDIIGKALIAYWRDGSPELRLAPHD